MKFIFSDSFIKLFISFKMSLESFAQTIEIKMDLELRELIYFFNRIIAYILFIIFT